MDKAIHRKVKKALRDLAHEENAIAANNLRTAALSAVMNIIQISAC